MINLLGTPKQFDSAGEIQILMDVCFWLFSNFFVTCNKEIVFFLILFFTLSHCNKQNLCLWQWWANIMKWTQTSIRIYSDATLCTERISEYIRWNSFTEWISEYICSPEIAQIRIRIIFEGHFIWIFEYLYSSLIEGIF